MIGDIFAISEKIRYVAVYRDGQLHSRSKTDTADASSSESVPHLIPADALTALH